MADDVKITMGADSTKAEAGISRVRSRLKELKSEVDKPLFKTGNKLESGISRMVQGIGMAQSETSALSVGMAGLASIMNAGVAGAAAFAFGQVIVNGAKNAKVSVEKLQESIRSTTLEVGGLGQMSNQELGRFAIQKNEQAGELFRQSDTRQLDFSQKAFGAIDFMGTKFANIFRAAENDQITFFENQEKLAANAGAAAVRAGQKAMEVWRERSEEMALSYQDTTQREEDVERLRAEHNENEAKRLQEEIRLKKELAAIDKMEITESARASMQATAMDRSRVRGSLESDRVTQRALKDIIAEEMKTPLQRQQERLDLAFKTRADERAIDRYTQRLQDKAQGKMSDEERNAMRVAMKADLRKETKNTQEADVRDIKETLIKWGKQIGIK